MKGMRLGSGGKGKNTRTEIMGDIKYNRRKNKKGTKKEIEMESEESIPEQLKKLGMSKKDFAYKFAVEVLQNYPDSYEVLSKLDEKALKDNYGFPYAAISRHGIEKVKEVLDSYGKESSLYLDGMISALSKSKKETIDEIVEKFDLWKVSWVAPIYKQLMKAQQKNKKEEIKQYTIRFYGRVQDVCFRDTSAVYANILDITGKVENSSDGSVYCEAQGTPSLVDVFILALRKEHKVRSVKKVETELKNKETEFTKY